MQDSLKLLNRYNLVRTINETRDFNIYEAFDAIAKSKVLIFFLKYFCNDFSTACEQLLKVKHPSLLNIKAYGIDNSSQFFISEYFEFKFLNFDSRISPLSNTETKNLIKHLVDLTRTEIPYKKFCFNSEYIIKTNQGSFKFIAIQPFIVHYIESGQISIFEKETTRRIKKDASIITFDNIERDHFIAIIFLVIEQFLSKQMIDQLLNSDDYFQLICKELLGKNNDLSELIKDTVLADNYDFNKLISFLDSNLLKDFSNPHWQLSLFENEISQVFIGLAKGNLFQCIIGEPLSGKTSVLTYIINQIKNNGEHAVIVKPKYEKNRRFILIYELLKFIIDQNMLSDKQIQMLPAYYQKYLKNIHHLQIEIKNDYHKLYEDTFVNVSVALIKNSLKLKKLFLIIDDADLMDKESVQFLNDFRFFFKDNNIQIVLTSIKSKFYDRLGALELGPNEIVNVKELTKQNVHRITKEYLNVNDVASYNLSSILYERTHFNYGKLIDYLNFIKMNNSIKNQMIDQETHTSLEFVNDVKVIIEQNVEKFRHLKEFLVFFTFIAKPIKLNSLLEVFNNNQSIIKLIDELSENHILKEDGFRTKRYLLSSFHVKQVVLQMFDNTLIMDVIKEFKSHSKLKYHFDYMLASDYMNRFENYDSAVNILFNYANILIYENLFEKVTDVFNQAYHIIDHKKVLIGQSLIKQNLLLMAEAFQSIKNYEGELEAYKKIELYIEIDSRDSVRNILQKYTCYLKMDNFNRIQELNNDNFSNKILSLNDINLTAKYNFLIGSYYQHTKNYTDSLNCFEKILENNSIDREIYLQVLHSKLTVLEETNQLDYYFSVIDDVLNKKHNFFKIEDVIEFYLKKGKYLFNQQKYNESKEVFEIAANKSVSNYLFFYAAECYSYLGAATLLTEKAKLAIDYFKHAYHYYKSVNELEKSAYMLGSLSVIYKDIGLISKAIETEKIVYRLFEETNNYDELIYSLANLGHTYSLVFDYDSAEKYLRNAVQLAKSIEKFQSLCHANLYLSTVYCFREDFSKAENILLETINLIDKNDSENYIHYVYYKSLLDFKTGNFEKAKKNLSLILESDLLNNNRKYNFVFLFLMGSIHVNLDDPEKGEMLLQKALLQAMKQDNIVYQLFINIQLFNLYEAQENEKKSFTLKSIIDLIKLILNSIDDPVLKITFLESNQLEKFSEEIKFEHIK